MISNPDHEPCAIVELRQYTLHPGQRDTLIELFDQEFVESQEAAGITVIGQFRDADHADRFVWLRGFPDMRERAKALASFYGGPVWAAHREAANATMIDSDDVLLLRPARPGSGLSLEGLARAPVGAAAVPPGLIVAHVCPVRATTDSALIEGFDTRVAPLLIRAGANITGRYVTESSSNNFPRLPVREGEHVFVWFSLFDDQRSNAHWLERLAADPQWRDDVAPEWNRQLRGKTQVLRLLPTARSRYHA
jgi:NIPSNAP